MFILRQIPEETDDENDEVTDAGLPVRNPGSHSVWGGESWPPDMTDH